MHTAHHVTAGSKASGNGSSLGWMKLSFRLRISRTAFTTRTRNPGSFGDRVDHNRRKLLAYCKLYQFRSTERLVYLVPACRPEQGMLRPARLPGGSEFPDHLEAIPVIPSAIESFVDAGTVLEEDEVRVLFCVSIPVDVKRPGSRHHGRRPVPYSSVHSKLRSIGPVLHV
jgi:hypothetical protein